MKSQIDILENEILEKYPDVLDILLFDHTTQKNILWATNNYEHLGEAYQKHKEIKPELITGTNGNIIMPRVKKDATLQHSRVKNMAEVFTPSWVCNAQNNSVDHSWFKRDNVFNKQVKSSDGKKWKTNKEKVVFPNGKTWQDYVMKRCLEITCGEAPYITSRYDTTTGQFIEVEERIGLLDRKLRIVNENVSKDNEKLWFGWTLMAYECTFAYEWQGDSLLLARESMLFSFIENYIYKFGKEPSLQRIQNVAYTISWNVWQMDGLKCVVPESCSEVETKTVNLFGEVQVEKSPCIGCAKDDIFKHNGIYCMIRNWSSRDNTKKQIRFVDLIKR